jgi:hypothetical protein
MASEETTVELDTTVMDSADAAQLGYMKLGDAIVEVGGEPDAAGVLPNRVRVTGEVTIQREDSEERDRDG